MTQGLLPAEETPVPPDIDENGVDRAQIREMLELPPLERLRRVDQLMSSVLEIWALNGIEERPAR